MLYAVRASKTYWHGGNKPEMLASWGTYPLYVPTRKAAVKFWFKSSARKLIAETHRAHREGQSFKIQGLIAALFESSPVVSLAKYKRRQFWLKAKDYATTCLFWPLGKLVETIHNRFVLPRVQNQKWVEEGFDVKTGRWW